MIFVRVCFVCGERVSRVVGVRGLESRSRSALVNGWVGLGLKFSALSLLRTHTLTLTNARTYAHARAYCQSLFQSHSRTRNKKKQIDRAS